MLAAKCCNFQMSQKHSTLSCLGRGYIFDINLAGNPESRARGNAPLGSLVTMCSGSVVIEETHGNVNPHVFGEG